jgi:excisionase family DNA binding protein
VTDTPAEIDRFLDVADCARILKMSERFIYGLLRAGEGPRYRKFGNRYRIRHSELMRWATRSPRNKGN